jgi:proteasome lid subunit RPN8/RPN11
MRTFSRCQFSSFLREARRAHRAVPGAEICGLIVDTGFHLSLVQARNASRRSGSFVFPRPDVRRIVKAAEVLGQEVVGTFHSHPVAPAIPGESDIANAVDNSLMLIFDCIACSGRLWRIRSGRAREVSFGMRPNKSDQPTSLRSAAVLQRSAISTL